MKIENIAIDASIHYKCLFIKHRFQSILRKVFPRYYVKKLDKDINSIEE